MLAGLDPAELDARLPAKLARVTERTLATPEALRRELEEVRRDGLAQDREEVTAGLVCFAAYVGVTPLGKRLAVSTSIPLTGSIMPTGRPPSPASVRWGASWRS